MLRRRRILQGAGLCVLASASPSALLAAPAASPGPYDWKSVPFGGGGFVDGFVFHPKAPGLLYARTDIGGAYRFDAPSKSWLPLLDHLSRADADLMGVLSLAIDPADPERLYAACGLYPWSRDGAVLASADRGATWQVTELHLKIHGNQDGRGTGERLQVDPNQGSILLLGTSQDGLLKSADRARSFSRLGFAPRHVSLVLFDPRSGSPGTPSKTVYVGSHDEPGLYVSHDAGESFAREPGTPAQVPQRAVFAADGSLYVTFGLGNPWVKAINPSNVVGGSVWKRDPGGHWTDITPVVPGQGERGFGYSGVDVDSQAPGRVVVSTIDRWKDGDEIFLSSDGGAKWTALGARSRHDASPYPWLVDYMHGRDTMGHWIADLKIDPFNGSRAIYGTGYGLWMTDTLGAAGQQGGIVDWAFASANFEETATLEIKSPSGGATLLGAMGDVSGGAWDKLDQTPHAGLFAPTSETNRSVDFAELNPGILARTADQAATGGYWSADGGASWRPFGPSARMSRAADGGHLEVGRIAVSAKGNFFLWAPQKQGALCSRDHGKTWKEVTGWPESGRDLVPVADRAVDGVFYVHDLERGQILASSDGGESFQPAVTGLPVVQNWQSAQLLSAPGTLRDLWLALPDGLLHLAGPDQRAKTIRRVAEPWMIALGKGAPGSAHPSLYVWGLVSTGGAAAEGLFRSDDAGEHFTRINDDAHRYGRLLSMAGDALEHGTVYLAPHGRGIVVGRPRMADSK